MRPRRALALALGLLTVRAAARAAVPGAADPRAGDEPGAVGRPPPRLSFVDGQVSFWRPGAEAWAEARVNTALAPGDELYTGAPGNLELQVGARAYVRAWGRTQLGLVGLEPDFAQLEVTTGHVSLDLRRIDPGRTVEVDTPDAAFTLEHPGYYRITVGEGRTSFIARRGVGAPRWLGRGGPRIVNGVVVTHTTVVQAHDVRVYRNAGERHAITAVPRDRFGHGPVPPARLTPDAAPLEPVRGRPDVPPARASLVPHGIPGPATPPTAAPRLVPAPPRAEGVPSAPRPPFGSGTIERQRSAPPPRPDRTPPPAPGSRPAAPPPAAARPPAR
jgi:hypothetical protein